MHKLEFNMDLKKTFNEIADQYDKSRPKYSKSVIETILKYKKFDRDSDILEIGCGTGQATELLIDLDSEIDCIDIGDDLIRIAKSKFVNHKNIRFILAPYEDYIFNKKYDMILSATAYHWIKQPEGDKKTRELLKNDGVFVKISTINSNKEEGYFKKSQSIYEKYFIEKIEKNNNNENIKDTDIFETVHKEILEWKKSYTSEEYLMLLSTYSDHRNLESSKRIGLFRELKYLIDSNYNGIVLKEYQTVVEIKKLRKIF